MAVATAADTDTVPAATATSNSEGSETSQEEAAAIVIQKHARGMLARRASSRSSDQLGATSTDPVAVATAADTDTVPMTPAGAAVTAIAQDQEPNDVGVVEVASDKSCHVATAEDAADVNQAPLAEGTRLPALRDTSLPSPPLASSSQEMQSSDSTSGAETPEDRKRRIKDEARRRAREKAKAYLK